MIYVIREGESIRILIRSAHAGDIQVNINSETIDIMFEDSNLIVKPWEVLKGEA